MEQHPRYSIIDCVVTGYAHYGIIIATDAGERGWIEDSYVADGPIRREEWPEVGARVVGVVLGYDTRSGRIRLATTPSYVAAIRGSEDPDAAASAWWAERNR